MTTPDHVQLLLKQRIEAMGIEVLWTRSFGYQFDSAFWVAVRTDAEKSRLEKIDFTSIFEESGYNDTVERRFVELGSDPLLLSLKKCAVAIESQETVDRDYEGNWRYAMA